MKYKNYLYSQNTEWKSWLDLGVQGLCLACKIQSSHQWQTGNKKKQQSFNTITPQMDRNRLKDTWHVVFYLHGTFALFDHLEQSAGVWPLSILMGHSIRPPPSFINRGSSSLLIGHLAKLQIRKSGWQLAFKVKMNVISWSALQWWSYSLFSRPSSLFLAFSLPRVVQLTDAHAQTHGVALPVIWRVPAQSNANVY